MKKYLFIIIIILFLSLIIDAGLLQAASIAVSEASCTAGTQGVLLSVDLITGAEENVAALQFDVSYDTAQLTFNEITADQVTLDAGKDVSSANPSTGTIRTIVYGLNQNSIANGTIATISFDSNASASAGEVALSVSNAVASDPNAKSLSLSTAPGSITITDANGSEEKSWPFRTLKRLPVCFIALFG